MRPDPMSLQLVRPNRSQLAEPAILSVRPRPSGNTLGTQYAAMLAPPRAHQTAARPYRSTDRLPLPLAGAIMVVISLGLWGGVLAVGAWVLGY